MSSDLDFTPCGAEPSLLNSIAKFITTTTSDYGPPLHSSTDEEKQPDEQTVYPVKVSITDKQEPSWRIKIEL